MNTIKNQILGKKFVVFLILRVCVCIWNSIEYSKTIKIESVQFSFILSCYFGNNWKMNTIYIGYILKKIEHTQI